ncbi:nuclease-related domain-containing protein [Solibacillus sp. CAU 1738]|uniref:nuclease-related domain-containing protein n=1 Tax=Solibacillus sp. CAU 1738 TaxID=3140363 RepID=UPI00326074E1
MIILQRKVPENFLVLSSLLRRLHKSKHNYPLYDEQHARIKHGLIGELRIDQTWQELTHPCKHYLFHNYTFLNNSGFSHQIDTLFLCPFFILIAEIKNIHGRIDLQKHHHQFTRTRPDGTIDGFFSPHDQLQRHHRNLQQLLTMHDFSIPIESIIVLASTKTIIGEFQSDIPIIHASGLQAHVDKLYKKHNTAVLEVQEVQQLVGLLLQLHQSKPYQIKFKHEQVIKGVLCSQCFCKKPMNYYHGTWHCTYCGWKDKRIFLETLQDYRLLFGPKITNEQLRDFCFLECNQQAKHLFRRWKLPSEGANKGRSYIIPDDILDYE